MEVSQLCRARLRLTHSVSIDHRLYSRPVLGTRVFGKDYKVRWPVLLELLEISEEVSSDTSYFIFVNI